MENDLSSLPEGWRWVRVADLCERVTVGYVSSTRSFFCLPGEGVRLVRSQNIRPGRLVLDDVAWVTRKFHEANPKSQLKPGDILITRVGANAGDVCIVPEGTGELHCSSAVFARPLSSHRKYLELFCRSPLGQQLLKSRIVGSVSERINTRDVESLPVLMPPPPEESAITCVLSALDHKIQLKPQMNETLEALARAIFKSWFVDFDPVHAKGKGRSPFGMNAETADLFPSSFQDSKLGRIPHSWTVGTVRDACDRVENGGTPRRSVEGFWHPPTIPWLTSGEVRQSILTSTTELISEEGYQHTNARLWPRGTTVVALYGATTGQVCILGKEMCANQACCGLLPKLGMTYFNFLRITESSDGLRRLARGSAQQNISQEIVAGFPIVIPESRVCKRFNEVTAPIFERAIGNMDEYRLLTTIRDAVLPKLISGEIRLKDAEKIVEQRV